MFICFGIQHGARFACMLALCLLVSHGAFSQQEAQEVWRDKPLKSIEIDYSMIKEVLSNMSSAQRANILQNQESLQNFIAQEAGNLAVYQAALDQQIDTDKRVNFLAKRNRDKIIRDTYLRSLIKTNLPEDFPTDEMVEKFYLDNKDKFVTDKRIHLWQIFLPISNGQDKKEIDKVKKQAQMVRQQLLDKKLKFADAAYRYSKDPDSRFQGGYLGLIRFAALNKAIKDTLDSMEPDDISQPILLKNGYYLYKTGETVAQKPVLFADIKDKVKQFYIREVEKKMLQDLLTQLQAQYPVVKQTEQELTKWYQNLNKELPTISGQK